MPLEQWDFYGQKDKQNVGCDTSLSSLCCDELMNWLLGGIELWNKTGFSSPLGGTGASMFPARNGKYIFQSWGHLGDEIEKYPDAYLRIMGKILPLAEWSSFSEVVYLTHCNSLQSPGIWDHQVYCVTCQGTTCLSCNVCTHRWWLWGKSVPRHLSVTISDTCGTLAGSTHSSNIIHIWRGFIFYMRKWNGTNSLADEKRNGIFQQKADKTHKIVIVEKDLQDHHVQPSTKYHHTH